MATSKKPGRVPKGAPAFPKKPGRTGPPPKGHGAGMNHPVKNLPGHRAR